jgi:methionyl-tRNA formyltransferase
MKIVFFGTPSFVLPVLESLTKHFEVVGVVTTPDAPSGRKKPLTPSAVKSWAIANLPKTKILVPEQFNNETIEQLKSLNPNLVIVAAYGKLIPQTLLAIPKYGSLNIHPSLLPKYRGSSPIQTAILNGDKETGVTIMQMDQELDHGPIVRQEKIELKGNETFESLHQTLFHLAANLLPSTIEQYSNKTISPNPQNEKKVIFCQKITREDGFFKMENPPDKDKLDRMIRAFYPWPTAWTKWEIAHGRSQIVKFLPEKRIQLEGGKPMSLKDFLNGYPALREIITSLV